MRVKRGVTTHKSHKKIIKQTKGMQRGRRRSIKLARQAVVRSLQYAYRDRRNRKRDIRGLWITRINAATRIHGMSYSEFMRDLKKSKIDLNRKTLAELAVNQPEAFSEVIKIVKK